MLAVIVHHIPSTAVQTASPTPGGHYKAHVMVQRSRLPFARAFNAPVMERERILS